MRNVRKLNNKTEVKNASVKLQDKFTREEFYVPLNQRTRYRIVQDTVEKRNQS